MFSLFVGKTDTPQFAHLKSFIFDLSSEKLPFCVSHVRINVEKLRKKKKRERVVN